ncbi:hypothetical protein [Sphingosinicella sp. BN140058]|uniref:hypothetical protein n=1 Tax=Sphingosinicella sp. BN140058 TaxID=1892855 RepID=UPI0010115A23|nr:hypothetical protein [Sphingosinicella sp. BN140058]QAY79159.1 hypothetical protein ETR14_23450 [Sphingosinicella sp. BN140058]
MASIALAAAVAIAASASVSGAGRTSVHPYLQIEQVLTADFNDGDVLTYTGVGGGVEASYEGQRLTATISYDYQRRIGWNGDVADDDSHSGLASVHFDAVPGVLALDAGAMAARASADPRQPVPNFRTADNGAAEVYSVYAGPTLSTHAGPLTVNAAYRLGYVYVDDDDSLAGGDVGPNQGRFDRYTSSTVHNLTASVGMSPGELPFGWTVGGGYVREDMNRLDATFEGKYVRGDVVVPVSPTLAVTGGIGVEDQKSSLQDFRRDAAGLPVIDANGRLVADPSRPRLVAYDESGLIWDAGILWRPSPRTELQARVGHRYGGTTFVGSLEHRINNSYALSASVYDNVASFGRLLVTDLAGVPRRFDQRRDPLTGGPIGLGGCTFGNDPGTGTCFDDALRSIESFNFRNRGANILLSGGRGPWNFGLGASYDTRRYLAPPDSSFILEGVTDKSLSLSASATRELTRTSSFGVGAYAGWFDSGIAGDDSSFLTGVTANYERRLFLDNIRAHVAAGLYTSQSGQFDSTVGSLLFGLSYAF